MPLQATSGAASYDGFGGGVPAAKNYIEDVFSTYLYTGNGSTQTITNGIDLSTKGGLVWIKDRTAANSNVLFDTARGANNRLISNLTNAQSTETDAVTSFNTNGFSIGASAVLNTSSNNLASWTFRKQPKFFDVVTYTGNGVDGRAISHNLGSVPGCIIVKRTDSTNNWVVWHTSSAFENLKLNTTAAASGGGFHVYSSSSTTFDVYNASGGAVANDYCNVNGATYVAYLFAHNAGGFGLTGTDNVISCGSLTCGAGISTATLGFEPQWLLIKGSNNANAWWLVDNMRGLSQSGYNRLIPNDSTAETAIASNYISITPTGFTMDGSIFGNGNSFVYIAIRRGLMKVPTSGTKVFYPSVATGSGTAVTTGFPVDLNMAAYRAGDSGNFNFVDRLRGNPQTSTDTTNNKWLISSSTAAETTTTVVTYQWWNTGYNIGPYGETLFYSLRRAPSFFDEVCYTGNSSTPRTITHNLGVAPELILVKSRSNDRNWAIYANGIGTGKYLTLTNNAPYTDTTIWANTAPTASVFTVGAPFDVNNSGYTYVAYLFATCAGVSKVGSYTGNGSSLSINCGFTGGARFVLIKRTDDAGSWHVFDTARGMGAGNDPYLRLDQTSAEGGASYDSISTLSSGFTVNQNDASNLNNSGSTYIFLAIA